MESLLTALTNKVENISSHWASYTVLGSFILYILGYLALRFHLTVLGVGTDLSVLDERYLFTGTRFLLYFILLVPSLLLLVLLMALPVYLPYRLFPATFKEKITVFFSSLWGQISLWWLKDNRLTCLGILFSLLMIQLVMRQCILLSNLLLADSLNTIPAWLSQLLLTQNEALMVFFFSGLTASVLVTASLFTAVKNRPDEQTGSNVSTTLLGFLFCIQLLLIPVNYGVLVIDKSMPRVIKLNDQKIVKDNEQAWLIWEGKEGKTFLLRKLHAGIYKKSLMTLPVKQIKRVEISGYDQIFSFLFASTQTKPET